MKFNVVHNKSVISIITILILLLVNQAFASNIIFNNIITTGPGVTNQMTEPSVDVNVAANDNKDLVIPIISTRSEIYAHDGKFYVKGESKGEFSISGYCACTICGTGTGLTASGKHVRANHTISADKKVLPIGTVIILENAIGKDGQIYDGVYVVEDTGGGVKNNHIDIYRPTHELATLVTHYGKLFGNVYIANEYSVATLSNIS